MGWPWAASRIRSSISSISSSNRRVGWAPRTAVCEAVRAWIVLPQAKVILVNVGALANHAWGTCPAANRRCRHSTTPRRLLARATQDDDVSFEQDGVGGVG